ncbi:hypothetical protein FACS1894211_08780 [Clostridia bacterium]|nr:hypothetical protein FACS1894211_08780 [Clostridia bacterium]
MAKAEKMLVNGLEVGTKGKHGSVYISLTDIARLKNEKDPRFIVYSWLKNKDTVSFLGLWETLNNPAFNRVEFDTVKSEAGANSFSLSPKEWAEKINGIGIVAIAGKYDSGIFAHEDIAFEFASWVSAEFKLYLIQEYKRLKISEQKQLAWDAKRELARINYHIQTDAIQGNLILPELTQAQKSYVYADEADLLNVVMFGKTAGQWRQEHKAEADKGENIRDYATLHELLVLANLESHNASFIEEKLPQYERLDRLRGIAERELNVLRTHAVNAPLLLNNGK